MAYNQNLSSSLPSSFGSTIIEYDRKQITESKYKPLYEDDKNFITIDSYDTYEELQDRQMKNTQYHSINNGFTPSKPVRTQQLEKCIDKYYVFYIMLCLIFCHSVAMITYGFFNKGKKEFTCFFDPAIWLIVDAFVNSKVIAYFINSVNYVYDSLHYTLSYCNIVFVTTLYYMLFAFSIVWTIFGIIVMIKKCDDADVSPMYSLVLVAILFDIIALLAPFLIKW